MAASAERLGKVVVIGGGPAGASCALTLLHGVRERSHELEVTVLEPKHFGRQYNQCAGVVTPAEVDGLLGAWGLELPSGLIQRFVRGFVLHAEHDQLELLAEAGAAPSCAIRRVQLDEFLLGEVARAGGRVVPDRMTDLEVAENGVIVYTEGRTFHADLVIGGFGLDPGAAAMFALRTGYRPPPCIGTLVTKLHPAGLEPIEGLLQDRIHAFLPRLPRVEFGALIPKGNHISAVVAGRGVTEHDMRTFLALPQVSGVLPGHGTWGDCFRGAFPVGLARHYWDNRTSGPPRYLMVGDAAGLVRPFKGGGIHTALVTGRCAALSLLEQGASARACAAYVAECRELRADVWYGRVLRALVALVSGPFHLEAILARARHEPNLRRMLYGLVSGRTSYQRIFREQLTPGLAVRAAWACAAWPWRLRGRSAPSDSSAPDDTRPGGGGNR
jgi:flavin-dependent dehydrogenase